MTVIDDTFAGRAQVQLGPRLGLEDFRVVSVEKISGNGLSRTAVRLAATSAGRPDPTEYVLLLEQASSPVAPNRDAEFAILRALGGHPTIPVPPVFLVEADPGPLGAPFLLSGLLPGTTNPTKLTTPELQPSARRVAEQSFTILGQLAAADVAGLELGPSLPIPAREEVWRRELDLCEAIITSCGCGDEVVTNAAFRYLRRMPPPVPARVSVVHGDYRIGNYLFDNRGIIGVIDWEMVHIGDAIEDLAWSLMPLWEYAAAPGLAGGCLTRDEAIAVWTESSGLTVDPYALRWWSVFCHLKAISIWATARHLADSNPGAGVMPGLVGYALIQRDEFLIAELLQGVTA